MPVDKQVVVVHQAMVFLEAAVVILDAVQVVQELRQVKVLVVHKVLNRTGLVD